MRADVIGDTPVALDEDRCRAVYSHGPGAARGDESPSLKCENEKMIHKLTFYALCREKLCER